MSALPTLVTIPAHPFEAAKRATGDGLVADERCGYLHRLNVDWPANLSDGAAVFCLEPADSEVHSGTAIDVLLRDWTDDETEAMNR